MLKIWSKVKDFWSIIFFCLKLTVEASPKFFILYVLLDVLIVVVPFAVIYVTSILINLLVEYAGSNDFNGVIRSLIIISLLMLMDLQRRLFLRLYLKWTNIIQMSRSEKHLTM